VKQASAMDLIGEEMDRIRYIFYRRNESDLTRTDRSCIYLLHPGEYMRARKESFFRCTAIINSSCPVKLLLLDAAKLLDGRAPVVPSQVISLPELGTTQILPPSQFN
jgi:hypothetical protein